MKTKIERKYGEKVSFEVGSIVTYSDMPEFIVMVTCEGGEGFEGVVLSNPSEYYAVGKLAKDLTKDGTEQFHGTITIEV